MSILFSDSKKDKERNGECFVIMPISDADGYEKGHFQRVYEDILKPACIKSGYSPVRADDVKQTNLIHLDILQKLIESPMAVCDLSSRNPNVLFELGLRQAFDKPTVLVQDAGTPKIFDIAPLRYTEYRRELKYREVIEDQNSIQTAISETKDAVEKGTSVNSIVKILSLSRPATLEDISKSDPAGILQLLRAEISELRSEFKRTKSKTESGLRPRIFDSSASRPSAISEINDGIDEVSFLVDAGAPLNLIISEISSVKKKISPWLDGSIPPWMTEEARNLLARIEELEGRALMRKD